MNAAPKAQHCAGIPLLMLKLASSVLLLLALGAMVLNVHHGQVRGSADPGAIAVVVSDAGSAPYTASTDSVYSSLGVGVAVCVFIVVWGLFLSAANFSARGGGQRMIAAVSPRGSPLRMARLRPPMSHLSLSQLSISRT